MLDEPSASLAPPIVADVFGLISEMRSGELGILLVEQVVEEAMAIADLESGRVIAHGPIESFSDTAPIQEIYLGHSKEELQASVDATND